MDNAFKNASTLGVEATYDVKDAMLFGVSKTRTLDTLSASHPLEDVLMKHAAKQEEIDMGMLRKMQGLHAPLRLHMEKMAVKDAGHLPCLYRHNAMLDALTGNDMRMQFEDFLNSPKDAEMVSHPHLSIERHMGLM